MHKLKLYGFSLSVSLLHIYQFFNYLVYPLNYFETLSFIFFIFKEQIPSFSISLRPH